MKQRATNEGSSELITSENETNETNEINEINEINETNEPDSENIENNPNTPEPIDHKIIRRDIWQLIIPIILEGILSMLANVISMAMLGRLDQYGASMVQAVSARGIAAQIANIMFFLFRGVSVGGTILISQALGREDEQRISRLAKALLTSLVVAASIGTVIVFLFAEPILRVVYSPEPEVLRLATANLKIVGAAFPAMAVMSSVTGIFQGRGNTRTPLALTALYNMINIALGFPLILGIPFGIVGGVVGNGIALASAQYVTAAVGLYLLYRKGGAARQENSFLSHGHAHETDARMPQTHADKAAVGEKGKGAALAKSIWAKGLPSSFESLFWQLAAIILSRVLLSYGDTAYSANQMGLQAESLVYMPMMGFGIATTTLTGKLLGAGKKELGHHYFNEIRKMGLVMMGLGSLVLILFPGPIMRLLTPNQEVIELGSQYLRIMGAIQIPQNMVAIYHGALKGAGITLRPMVNSFVGLWLVRVPLSLAVWLLTDWPVTAVWLCVAVDQTVTFALSVLAYRKYDVFEMR